MKADHQGKTRLVLRLRVLLLAAVMALLVSCGTDACVPAAISSLSPNETAAGGPDFTLSVGGENFGANTVLLWNGSSRDTTVTDATHLTAVIRASDIANQGTAEIKVRNQFDSAGNFICNGGDSSSLPFTIK